MVFLFQWSVMNSNGGCWLWTSLFSLLITNFYSFLSRIVSRFYSLNCFLYKQNPPSLFSCYKNWLDTLCGIDPNFHYCILLEKFRFYFWVSTTALQILAPLPGSFSSRFLFPILYICVPYLISEFFTKNEKIKKNYKKYKKIKQFFFG